jgi:hypothetical protein
MLAGRRRGSRNRGTDQVTALILDVPPAEALDLGLEEWLEAESRYQLTLRCWIEGPDLAVAPLWIPRWPRAREVVRSSEPSVYEVTGHWNVRYGAVLRDGRELELLPAVTPIRCEPGDSLFIDVTLRGAAE